MRRRRRQQTTCLPRLSSPRSWHHRQFCDHPNTTPLSYEEHTGMTAKGSAYREDKAPTLRRSLEIDAQDGDSVPQMQPAAIPQRVRSQPIVLTAPDLLHLQRTIGNQATQRLLARTNVLPPATQAVVQRGRGKPPAKQSTTGSGGARTGSAPDFIQPNDWKRTPQEI